MNCISEFELKSRLFPERIAFVSPIHRPITFFEFRRMVASAQNYFSLNHFTKGDVVLVACDISAELYALVVAILGLGGTVVLVEPWMPIKNIAESISHCKPKYFISSLLGKIWGYRVKEIRSIPQKVSIETMFRAKCEKITLVDVEDKAPGIITFTSGTSGSPKGVVREQGYLIRQFNVLKKHLNLDHFTGADLTIFANWTLISLAQGRTTVYFPPKWSASNFRWLDKNFKIYNIETLTCGPAFLKALMDATKETPFKEIHLGGALISIDFFKKVLQRFCNTKVFQIYGSSEVEPVCLVDAQLSVDRSEKKGFFHSLFLGNPIEEINYEVSGNGLWVTGPHVCPLYLHNNEDNKANKKIDSGGRVWHFMGDFILEDEGWFYQGRSHIEQVQFLWEQSLYTFIGHDNAFLVKNPDGQYDLFGENIESISKKIKAHFPFVGLIKNKKIIRDKRHRSRIDRVATLK